MINQFDIVTIDLDPKKGKEKNKYRPCLVVSNNLVNHGSAFSWVLPITNRPKRTPSDIEIKTKSNKVQGIIDTVQIRSVDLSVRNSRVVDELSERLRNQVLQTIFAYTEIV